VGLGKLPQRPLIGRKGKVLTQKYLMNTANWFRKGYFSRFRHGSIKMVQISEWECHPRNFGFDPALGQRDKSTLIRAVER